MLGAGFKAPTHDELAYRVLKTQLCWQFLNTLDTTIENEPEGLDVYIDIFATVSGVVQDFDPGVNFDGDTDAIQVIYAMKKKSDPEC